MIGTPPYASRSNSLGADLLLALFLIALIAAARVLPHAWNFAPVVAAGLFAGSVMQSRLLAFAVPVLGMALSDVVIGFDDWGTRIVVYAALLLPPILGGAFVRRLRVLRIASAALASSLIFFAASNFAVWLFSGMYSHDVAGLTQCFMLALPFLQYTIAGDLLWTALLFGGAWLVANRPALSRRPL
jgi:hypothetical protein